MFFNYNMACFVSPGLTEEIPSLKMPRLRDVEEDRFSGRSFDFNEEDEE